MSKMKENYTSQEWAQRESYYRDTLISLTIPEAPTNAEVKVLISALDVIMTEATFECAMIERKFERASLELKNAEAELFNILKQQQLLEGVKVTELDVKGLVKTHLKNNNIAGFQTDIYTILKVTMDRHTYMKAVVKAISEKKSSIISALSILKLEGTLSPNTKDVNLEYIA